jgi:hypothetical protein
LVKNSLKILRGVFHLKGSGCPAFGEFFTEDEKETTVLYLLAFHLRFKLICFQNKYSKGICCFLGLILNDQAEVKINFFAKKMSKLVLKL